MGSTKQPGPPPPGSRPAHSADVAKLAPLVYEELRRIARRQLRGEAAGQSLQPTALVHEAYVRLAGKRGIAWQGRTHFLAAAATEMRRILVDHARASGARKRGGRAQRVTLDEAVLAVPDRTFEVLALDQALSRLDSRSPRQARVTEMRLFGGMLVGEIGEALGVSERTVKDDWRVARAWLVRELRSGGSI